MHTPLLALLALVVLPSLANAEPAFDAPALRFISAGTKLKIKRDIYIPANADRARITSASSGLDCFVRMNRPRPYARVIRAGRELTVTNTERSAMSARSRVYANTRLLLLSESVDDIQCVGRLNQDDPRIGDFKQAVSATMTIETPDNAVDVG